FNTDELKKFPKEPGVYIMKDAKHKVLYVGKAKNLQNRVKQYFVEGRDEREMIPHLVKQISSIDTIVVLSEKEALLLENTLIKRHKPKYNVLLKDDKTYISLMINHKHQWPMVKLVRYTGKPKKDGLYFGPYTSTYAARQTYEVLSKVFPLRQCSDNELKSRTRPCLLYGIKRCCAPCVRKCTKDEYDMHVTRVIQFLRGHDKQLLKDLKQEMEKASDNTEYEKAGALHKKMQMIERVLETHKSIVQYSAPDSDAWNLYREGNDVILVQLIFREGRLVGSEHYNFDHIISDDEEIWESFILQHYRTAPDIPEEVLLPCKVNSALSDILTDWHKAKTSVLFPKQGKKKALIDMAMQNAKAFFHREKEEQELKEKRLMDLQEALSLDHAPVRIECFDTSSISGSDTVAALAAFTDGAYDKKRTRFFKIHTAPGDDYGALKEALTRRLTRAKEEDDMPDLIIIDGGKGQLNVALTVLTTLEIASCDVISIVKDKALHTKSLTHERIFMPGKKEALTLPKHSPALFFLQHIRDEAHRLAIGYHRKKRSKRIIKSSLDDASGIGPIKKKRLLQHFGSIAKIKAASDEELSQIQGITQKDIETLRLL
ncbi:MAG: excinuclease ABC subunit UvrC, partial [Chlamydiia bacterium]|nr:excinuclease ABC subunit UvrC [Chlamydiia bacterium]